MRSIAKIASALLALTSTVSGTITIMTTSLKGNATNTVTWSSSNLDADPTVFTMELANPVFRNNFALVNNVGTAQGSATFTLPDIIPGSGYSIQFVNPGNISQIFAESNTFTINENDVGTGAADPASTTITTALTTGGITITSVISTKVSASSTPAATATSPATITSLPNSVSSSATPPSTLVSTTAAPAASSAAPNGAGIVHVPVTLLMLGLAAGFM